MKKQSTSAIAVLVLFAVFSVLLSSCKKGESLVSETKMGNVNLNGRLPAFSPTVGLIAYWPLDGNGTDLSGNSNNGTLNNVSAVADRFGNSGKACHFNGSSSYISVADNASLRLSGTDFTLNAWVKLDSYNSSYGSILFSKRFAGINNGYVWTLTGNAASANGELSFGPGGGNTNAFGTVQIDTTHWHMVTGVYSSSSQEFRIYIDGIYDNVTTGILNPNSATTALLYMGYDPAANGYYLNGAMDDVRIYGQALNQTTISGLYDEPNPAKLIAYWPFDNNANDYSGNGHNGTGNNVTSVADRFGNSNSAYSFDGFSSYISVPDSLSLRLSGTDFTLNAWVKISSYNSSYGSVILSKRFGGYNNGYTWTISGNAASTAGVVSFGPGGGNTNAFGTTVVDTVQWHMVTSVYNSASSQLSVYVDGTLDNVTNSILTPSATTSAQLNIGYDSTTGLYYYHGSMDDIKIYRQALTASAVKATYNGYY